MDSTFSRLASTFVFESFSFDKSSGRIVYVYTTEQGHTFNHELTYRGSVDVETASLAPYLFALGMAELPHYWKTTLAPQIIVKAGNLSKDQIAFWHTLYEKGLGEFFYTNNIDYRNIFTISVAENAPMHAPVKSSGQDILVPFGGGKDSLITGEFLKKEGHDFAWFELEQIPRAEEIQKISGVERSIQIERNTEKNFKPIVDLVKHGAPNGHVPITATYMFSSVLAAKLFGARDVVFSLERSANIGNITYLGQTINHQYSKSYEFEKAASEYIKNYVDPHIRVFSLLRPLHEIQILKHFSKHPDYFGEFISCNKGLRSGTWCKKCAKCAFMFAGLSAFLEPKQVAYIFGENMFDDESLIPLYKELAGIEGFKPFDCVGTIEENLLALYLAKERYTQDNVPLPKVLHELDVANGASYIHLLSETTDEHNIPIPYTSPKPV